MSQEDKLSTFLSNSCNFSSTFLALLQASEGLALSQASEGFWVLPESFEGLAF
jgi:hypothetical protein